MRLKHAILSGLMILSMLGIGGLQVLPASAASGQNTQSTTTSVSSQSSSISNLETQLDQQGVGFSALLNLLKQFGVSSGRGTSPQSGVSTANNASSGGTLLAKAQPDACFAVTGGTLAQPTSVSDTPIPQNGVCPQGTQPKTDQAYVWGLTQSGHDLWFGTAANTQCLVEGSYLHTTTPSGNQDAVCEFGVSGNPYAALGSAGDWRPPHVYVYDLQSNGGVNSGLTDAATIPGNGALSADLTQTLGLRSAGSVGNYVLLAGPALSTSGGVNVYIFTANNHAYQGMVHLAQYDNIRKWLTYNGVLYTSMHLTAPALGGDVLKWTPNANNLLAQNNFTVVGHVNGDPAELAVFNNQMFVSTWPDPTALANLVKELQGLQSGSATTSSTSLQQLLQNLQNVANGNPANISSILQQILQAAKSGNSASVGTALQQLLQKAQSAQSVSSQSVNISSIIPVAGLFMSPAFSGSLGASSATWSEPWSVLNYEPDLVTALTYGGGAISVYNGMLYWGTMHVPAVSTLLHVELFGAGILPAGYTTQQLLQVFENSERAIAIFRGTNFGKFTQTVQLLYGEKTLPVWIPNSLANIQGPGNWYNIPTKAGNPLYGASGFGNPFNNYTWSMAVYKGSLYVGTMDWSMLAGQASAILGGSSIPVDPSMYGADLWKFTSGSSPAVAVNTQGMGNPYNYGIRNMITSTNGKALYLGMANPMNLAQNPPGTPVGGWELRVVK